MLQRHCVPETSWKKRRSIAEKAGSRLSYRKWTARIARLSYNKSATWRQYEGGRVGR